MAEKKKAWLYLKARTDEDLKAQKSLLLEYADKAGYEVTEVAADYSPSQSSLKYVRLGAAKHDFEVLLISSWNRLGRDLSETLEDVYKRQPRALPPPARLRRTVPSADSPTEKRIRVTIRVEQKCGIKKKQPRPPKAIPVIPIA